jgi:hypothetical protein
MIALSLFASLVLTTAALGLITKPSDNLALASAAVSTDEEA